MRVIIYSNVVIAAVASRGLCEALMRPAISCMTHRGYNILSGVLEGPGCAIRIQAAEVERALKNPGREVEI